MGTRCEALAVRTVMLVGLALAAVTWSAISSGISIESTRPDRSRHFTLGVAATRGLAFVVQFLSLSERQCQLRHALPEVELERDERQTLALDRSDETTDFLAVEQQL